MTFDSRDYIRQLSCIQGLSLLCLAVDTRWTPLLCFTTKGNEKLLVFRTVWHTSQSQCVHARQDDFNYTANACEGTPWFDCLRVAGYMIAGWSEITSIVEASIYVIWKKLSIGDAWLHQLFQRHYYKQYFPRFCLNTVTEVCRFADVVSSCKKRKLITAHDGPMSHFGLRFDKDMNFIILVVKISWEGGATLWDTSVTCYFYLAFHTLFNEWDRSRSIDPDNSIRVSMFVVQLPHVAEQRQLWPCFGKRKGRLI